MVSLANIYQEFHEIIENNKNEIKLVLKGQDIKVDRAVINRLAAPLTNLLKSLINNIEKAETRKNMGKAIKGEVSVSTHKTGNEVIIEFEDDGKRIDLKELEEKIVINNIVSKEELKKMSREEKYNLLLKDNISAEKLLDDVDKKITEIKKAKAIIEELNGKLYLELSEDQNLKK